MNNQNNQLDNQMDQLDNQMDQLDNQNNQNNQMDETHIISQLNHLKHTYPQLADAWLNYIALKKRNYLLALKNSEEMIAKVNDLRKENLVTNDDLNNALFSLYILIQSQT